MLKSVVLRRPEPSGAQQIVDLLEEAVNTRWRSAENLSRQAGLAPGTVRNIIKAGGRGSPESLARLAPFIGKTPRQIFELAGWLEPEPDTTDPLVDEAARLVESLPPEMRPVALSGLRGIVQGLQEPDYQRAALRYLRAAERPESAQ